MAVQAATATRSLSPGVMVVTAEMPAQRALVVAVAQLAWDQVPTPALAAFVARLCPDPRGTAAMAVPGSERPRLGPRARPVVLVATAALLAMVATAAPAERAARQVTVVRAVLVVRVARYRATAAMVVLVAPPAPRHR